MSSANSYNSTSTQHMCDMDSCVLKTSLSLRNFGRRFYGCQHWSPIRIKIICSCPDSDQAGKFFRWLDRDTCPRGLATAPIVRERFTRLAAEAEAAKNERDNAQRMETEALEWERLAKRIAEKYRVAVRSAEEKGSP
ncbi:hypothetical protein SO802_017600 [Lithocarpus litseifolius]|uniref:Zinc finger GRF-type domain-containing protein n=1 Tax=Lithocarpus litseifolius TaxID=425828 RepID=A0AAW2CKS4_9ROSI